MIPSSQPLPEQPWAEVSRALALVAAVPPDGYTPLPSWDELPDGVAVEQDSRRWAGRFMAAAANPYAPGLALARDAHRATPSTHDLIRHRYPLAEHPIQIHEGATFWLVRATGAAREVLAGDEDRGAAAVTALAARLLAVAGSADDAFGGLVPYRWNFTYHPPLKEGARFSTAPTADPLVLSSWAARVDGGIDGGDVYFLCHKARASGDGRLLFLDGSHWFDGQCWHPYQTIPRP